ENAGQQARMFGAGAGRSCDAVLPKCRLDSVPKLFVDNGCMLPGIAIALVGNLAKVSSVLKQQVERSMREPLLPVFPPIGVNPALAPNAGVGKFLRKGAD